LWRSWCVATSVASVVVAAAGVTTVPAKHWR
jgi:hypothetical protein